MSLESSSVAASFLLGTRGASPTFDLRETGCAAGNTSPAAGELGLGTTTTCMYGYFPDYGFEVLVTRDGEAPLVPVREG